MIDELEQRYSYVTKHDYEAVAGPNWPPFSQFTKHQHVDQFVYNEIDQMLKPPAEFSHPSFCVLPFYGIEYPRNKICCLIKTNVDRKQLCEDMLAGIRAPACSTCWKMEDAGLKSDRLNKNQSFEFYSNKTLTELYDECLQGNNTISHYKIDSSNVCNAACVTCGSYDSSSWAKLQRDNHVRPSKTYKIHIDQATDWIDFDNAKTVAFRGGESFLSATNFKILEKLPTSCGVAFTTNGSVRPSKTQLKAMAKFKHMNICVSVDGTGPVFEYLRHPLQWEAVQQNIDLFRDQGFDVSISYTLSNLNVLYFGQTVDWFEHNQLLYHTNLVTQPSCFRVSALPVAVKQIIVDKHRLTPWADQVNALLATHSRRDDIDYKLFLAEIAKQDQWKNVQLKHYLPELHALLDQ